MMICSYKITFLTANHSFVLYNFNMIIRNHKVYYFGVLSWLEGKIQTNRMWWNIEIEYNQRNYWLKRL